VNINPAKVHNLYIKLCTTITVAFASAVPQNQTVSIDKIAKWRQILTGAQHPHDFYHEHSSPETPTDPAPTNSCIRRS